MEQSFCISFKRSNFNSKKMEKPRGYEEYLKDKDSYKYYYTAEAYGRCQAYEKWLEEQKAVKQNLKVQFAEAVSCDFSENTATFEFLEPLEFRAGTFAIIPKSEYERLINRDI